jgi:hypothetical protein
MVDAAMLARLAQDIQARFGERYHDVSRTIAVADVPQVSLLPTVDDAPLWMIPVTVRRFQTTRNIH